MAKTLVKTDKNGTRYFEEKCSCWKCNGTGTYIWGANGCYSGVCFACEGRGYRIETTKEFTAEHEAKLQKARDARNAARRAEAEKQAEARKAQLEAEAQRQARIAEERAKSEYIGKIGDKIEMAVTFKYKASYEMPSFRGYGMTTMHIYGMEDQNGNALVWKTSGYLEKEVEIWNKDHTQSIFRCLAPEAEETIIIKAKIKDHSEYKGQKQTIIERVKISFPNEAEKIEAIRAEIEDGKEQNKKAMAEIDEMMDMIING